MTFLAALLLLSAQDSPKEHAESVGGSTHAYKLTLGGVADAASMRDPIGYSAPIQWFEPMKSVRIENVGDRDVVNPWLTVNGKRNWRTAKEIVAEALAAYGNPATDAAKARAIWEYQRHHRFHATTYDAEVQDPVKVYNVYGYTLCGDEALVLADLWRLAGLKVRRGYPTGHVVSEVWYDDAWHLLDSDEHIIALLRDNRTIASEEDVVRDHDLLKRTHAYGILQGDLRKTDEFSASLYVYEGKREGAHPSRLGHAMTFILRPGEALEWRWDHKGKLHAAGETLKDGWSETAHARLRNGTWTYRPRVPGPWKISTPYAIVGGRVRGGAFSISFDQKTWSPVAGGNLDPHFPTKGPARYAYWVRLDGAGAAEIENDLQMAALGLPCLELGENVLRYSDETREPHQVRITHQWVERHGAPPPAAPAAPISPVDAVEGTRVVFQWPAGEKILDYQFQLGDHPELRWVLSPNFDKLVRKAQHTLPYAGLLNPGQRYYWRVRARDDRHLWGPWSKTWSFVAQGPGVPLRVRWESGRLAWDANPEGRPPVKYEIYASNEKGFTASDAEHPIYAGNQKEGGLFPGREFVSFPSNRIEPEARPTWAFYRVIAIDGKGVKSGASDLLAAKRPSIFTEPPTMAKVGVPYRYEAKTIRSIGDLRCRTIGAECYNAAYWDAEQPRFSLKGPAWLAIDAATGVVTGTPSAAGEVEVVVTVEIPGVGVDRQSYRATVQGR